MTKKSLPAKRPSLSSLSPWVMPLGLLVFATSFLLTSRLPASETTTSMEVMRIWADHNWDAGTTSLPISRTSVLAKQILSKKYNDLPGYLHEISDTISIKQMMRFINDDRYAKLMDLCPSDSSCDVLTPDPEYGLTPLHLASFAGDGNSVQYILKLGANPDAFDNFNRKPANLTFSSFIVNSKRFAALRESPCQLPEIFIDSTNVTTALSEIHRLVSEGEPLIVRNLVQIMDFPELLEWDSASFIRKFGQTNVTVGSVPYASYFGLKSQATNIADYMAVANNGIYIFSKNDEISANAFKFLNEFVEMAFPKFFTAPRILGTESIHFYLGQNGSGAPYHLHSDAVNLLIHGRKSWFITPPLQSVYSRLPIHEYLNFEDRIPSLQCDQNPGDMIYVPFDWGHAVINTEDETFGFAVELLNDRDSFRFLKEQF